VNRVRAGFFSITPPAPETDDGGYLRWHLLDHMPEQYQLPGMVHAMRWTADGDLPDHRIAATGSLADVGGVVNYLFSEPVQQTYDDFMDLGRSLAEAGRFPESRPSLQLRLLELHDGRAAPAALVSPEVVPFRPHRGVLLIVEEPAGDIPQWQEWLSRDHYPELLGADGVAGAWRYGATDTWTVRPTCEGGPQFTTVVYLDRDPVATTAALAPIIERRWASGEVRPIFAGPLRTMMQWDAWSD
jgi:hypothetical protein